MGRKFLLAAAVLAAVFVFLPRREKEFKNLSVAEFDAAVADAFVVDVHTPEQTHLSGTDAFIPLVGRIQAWREQHQESVNGSI